MEKHSGPEKNLAIVIPAFKQQFLRETLHSISSQTCIDFHLYIGDDASPHPIAEIVEEFKDKLDLTYKRFDKNLGAKYLVGHWERCIEMTRGEEWIWLFTDDDLMGLDCVKVFYKALKKYPDAGLLRFNKTHVNENGKIKFVIQHHSPTTLFEDFTDEVLELKKAAVTLPEFIFSRSLFEKFGLVNLPLAWGTDKASFLQFASALAYIINLDEYIVFNESGLNISNTHSREYEILKTQGNAAFNKWLLKFSKKIAGKQERQWIKKQLDQYLDRQVHLIENRNYSKAKRLRLFLSFLGYANNLKNIKNLYKMILS